MNNYQNWLVVMIVAAAALYILRAILTSWQAAESATGKSCSGCSACPTGGKTLVEIQGILEKKFD